jgi:hypothetical protein
MVVPRVFDVAMKAEPGGTVRRTRNARVFRPTRSRNQLPLTSKLGLFQLGLWDDMTVYVSRHIYRVLCTHIYIRIYIRIRSNMYTE